MNDKHAFRLATPWPMSVPSNNFCLCELASFDERSDAGSVLRAMVVIGEQCVLAIEQRTNIYGQQTDTVRKRTVAAVHESAIGPLRRFAAVQ
jgi:hypothetical protein